MYTYVNKELPELVGGFFQVDASRLSITGHSMGGLGALVGAIRNPGKYRSVSAFAPITNPMKSEKSHKAFVKFFDSEEAGKDYDPTELIRSYKGEVALHQHLLIDQGTHDEHLKKDLLTEDFKQVCGDAGWPATIRLQDGYDHSPFFCATFIRNHIEYHALHLGVKK